MRPSEGCCVSWQPINLAAPEFDRPTEPPAVCGLIYRGKRHALSGPPEAAKTLAALIFGLEHMRSGLGTFALIDFEMGEHATRLMLHDLGATLEEIAAVYYVNPDAPPEAHDIESMAAAGVTLAIIDAAAGAYDISGLDDYQRKDAERFAHTWITPLWQREITTLILDHVVKNGEARGRYAIGSERKLGTVDVHLGCEAVRPVSRGGNGLIRVTTHKDRPGHLERPHPAELELYSDPETHAISWEFKAPSGKTEKGWKPTVLMEKVSRWLEQQEPLQSRNKVELAKLGAADYVRQAMDELTELGFVKETPGPRNARQLTVVRPFREDDLTSSDLVATSSDEVVSDFVSSSSAYRRDEDEDEVVDEPTSSNGNEHRPLFADVPEAFEDAA